MSQQEFAQGNQLLCEAITQKISASPQQQITFAEYMDLALYHPQYGYYISQNNIGAQGDFFTAPHLGADFGQLLATQFVEIWEILGKPVPFQIVEMGAGQGLIAGDVLEYLQQHHPSFFASLEYLIVEKSTAMRLRQQQRLAKCDRVQWCDWDDIPADSITGCFFSNELVDAFPVHLITLNSGEIQEIYVTSHKDGFTEAIAPVSTPQIYDYFDLVGINFKQNLYQDGYRTEVNLAALDWLKKVASKLKLGYILTIDYGYPATRYYSPQRSQGTLQCYYRHRHHDDPYCYIGQQDITAHVDFTALERQGELCGLQRLGLTQQALFLMALGLGDRIAAVSTTETDLQSLLRRRQALHELINPMGLGGFNVLLQGKGLSETQPARSLRGFQIPMA